MNIYIHTLGCKVNQYESQAIAENFEKHGWKTVTDPLDASLIAVNSCTVTAESDRKTRQTVRKLKAANPDAILLLTGCSVQAFPEKYQRFCEADIIVGNTETERIYDIYLEFCSSGRKRTVSVVPHETDEKYSTPEICRFNERTRAYVKIEDGCNRFCSYCAIPFAKGRVRSRDPKDIKQECLRLEKAGFKEIVLVGINLTAYGQDNGFSLSDAVTAAAEPDGIKRIRLGSMELDQISDEVLDTLSECEKFCPQFHLSLQSGCDATLKRMNRHYDTAFYEDFVKRIKSRFDNPSVTTDIMVGFAGESEEDFLTSLEFAKRIGFAKMHVFAYSKREGTKAYSFEGQIQSSVKLERSKRMAAAAKECEHRFLLSQVGLCEEVLFENEENGYFWGFTKNYTRVAVVSESSLSGKICPVLLTKASDGYCEGKLV